MIKTPAAYDVAHWEGSIDWSKVVPRPLWVACKATEGDFYNDITFAPNMQGLKTNNINRAAYHFHRKANNPQAQAKKFCDFIRPYISNGEYLILDIEEGGETATQIIQWFDYVRNQFTNPLMLYSRKNLLDPIVMTTAQKAYFKAIPVWTAGYPDNPDLFNSPPAGYIPDQTKFGPVYVWQYSDHGVVDGIVGGVDLDWLAPEFVDKLYLPPPTGDTMDYRCKINGLAYRSGGASTFAQIDVLNLGDVVTGVLDGWIHGSKITRANSTVVIKDGWCSSSASYMELVTPPPVAEYLVSETIEPASGTVITKLYNTGRVEKITIP